jgi:hypothetical protein
MRNSHYPLLAFFKDPTALTVTLAGRRGFVIVLDTVKGFIEQGTATHLRIFTLQGVGINVLSVKPTQAAGANQIAYEEWTGPVRFAEGNNITVGVDELLGTVTYGGISGTYHYEPCPVGDTGIDILP